MMHAWQSPSYRKAPSPDVSCPRLILRYRSWAMHVSFFNRYPRYTGDVPSTSIHLGPIERVVGSSQASSAIRQSGTTAEAEPPTTSRQAEERTEPESTSSSHSMVRQGVAKSAKDFAPFPYNG